MTKEIVLKELSNTLSDQAILNEMKNKLEKRIVLKLNQLGVRGSSYSEVVIKISGVKDKYAEAFIKVENLIERRDYIVKELKVIEDTIIEVRDKMKDSHVLEYEVFNLHYFENLTLQEIAKKINYSLDRVKQISAKISKKFNCQ